MNNSTDKIRLFVYGTLLSFGRQIISPDKFDIPVFRRNTFIHIGSVLDRSIFLGSATTSGMLYDVGRYPAMVTGKGTVYGEVYLIDQNGLRYIDLFEGFEENNSL